jgi:hypothetical protein
VNGPTDGPWAEGKVLGGTSIAEIILHDRTIVAESPAALDEGVEGRIELATPVKQLANILLFPSKEVGLEEELHRGLANDAHHISYRIILAQVDPLCHPQLVLALTKEVTNALNQMRARRRPVRRARFNGPVAHRG